MSGMIAWFARNPVAANLMMVFIIVSGAMATFVVNAEVFPEVSLDTISIEVPYLGAAPEEVELAVCVRIEEAVQGIDGIKTITATAAEGMGRVLIELELDADSRKVIDDVKNSVDAITTFPAETEKPIIRELLFRNKVIDVAVSGRADELTLKTVAERVRDEIAAVPGISLVEITSARPYEIAIEVSEVALRRHGLTFDDVAAAVRRSSLDIPGGSVRAADGEILLRTIGQAYRGGEFESLIVRTRADGTRLHLRDVATVVDGFAETDQSARFDDEAAILVSVFRTGDQNAMRIASLVHDYVARSGPAQPPGVSIAVWQDAGAIVSARLQLMLKTGLSGFILVFVLLALFLEARLAFWVSLGIPISFLGAIMLMPSLDVTVNVLSLFAFILVLGIVVDDAIIVGEHIHTHQERSGDRLGGAIAGAQGIATPVVFAVLTTVAAFMPLMFVPGLMGKFFRVIPLIVIPALLFSLLESLNILPAHLAHRRTGRRGPWGRAQAGVANAFKRFVHTVYRPVLQVCLRWRYVTAASGMATLVLTVGLVYSGWVTFQFFPSIESDFISASVTMPQGTPPERTSEILGRLEDGVEDVRRTLIDETGVDHVRHFFTAVGNQPTASQVGSGNSRPLVTAAHIGEIMIELEPAETRVVTSEVLGNRWRETTGPIPEATGVDFRTSAMDAGDDIDVQLVGPHIDELRAAADDLKQQLRRFPAVYGIRDTFEEGKPEVQLAIKPAAETLGLSLQDLGRQVRQAFYGEEAQRIQRDRDDIRVMVRYPAAQRRSLGNLENMRIRTPAGTEVPFSQVATVTSGRSLATIDRVDRRRAVNVVANVDDLSASSTEIIAALQDSVLPAVLARYPGVSATLEGVQAERRDSVYGLQIGFSVTLLVIFSLLAIPLKSYVQPLIIMSAIPFGLIGAVWGHVLLGYNVSLMSMFGLVALSGVVVNDSLIMVAFINTQRKAQVDLLTAVREAGVQRFRPILLTSLTTFCGLVPLMLERSMQAAFMIPMAVSLAFGVLFATVITLVLVPTGYLILDDLGRGVRWLAGRPVAADRTGLAAQAG